MKQKAFFAVFLWLALSSTWVSDVQAFTLGQMRGSVSIGRSLDLSATVQASSGEEVLASCFAAEVFYGDTPQQGVSLGLTPLPVDKSSDFTLRIRTSAPVNEPTVSVLVRSTCVSSISRRYVMLADFPVVVLPRLALAQAAPTETFAATSPSHAAQSVEAATVPAVASVLRVPATAVDAAAPPKPVVKNKQRSLRKKAVRKSPQSDVALASVATAALVEPNRAILKLDEVLTLPVGPVEPKAEVTLPLLWTQTSSQTKQMQALQDQVKTLSEQSAKNNAALLQLQMQLQQAQSGRVSSTLFYVVLALLLLLTGGLLWLLWQRYRVQPTPVSDADILTELSLKVDAPAEDKKREEFVHLRAPSTASPYTRWPDVDTRNFGVHIKEEVDPDIDMNKWVEPIEVAPVAVFNSASVLDIRQQAEFFVSLGQTERALVILKKQIAESDKPNPLIYLDLLSLFHSQGDKSDFREYRTAFNRHFNCVLPDFPAYHLEGLDLTAYTDELARLTLVWHSQKAIDYLHDCIYRSEQASAQPSFELAAFRDLLMLYAMAEQLMNPTET